MNKHLDIRDLIRRGPSDRDEATAIVATAIEHLPETSEPFGQRLSSALMEMLVCRHLRSDCYEARAQALSIIDEIEKAHLETPVHDGSVTPH